MITKRLNGVRYAIRDVLAEAAKVRATGKRVLNLNIGDPNAFDFDTPEPVRAALKAAADGKRNGYGESQGLVELREEVAAYNKSKGMDCQAGDVLVSIGLSDAIHMLATALVEEGGNALLPAPTYPLYESVVKMNGGEPRFYECLEGEGWRPDLDDLRRKADGRTAFVSVINPNNPTGAVYSRSDLKALADFAGELGVPLLSDEVYDRLVFEGEHVSVASLAKDVPVVTMNGLSKNFFAPGWRSGWLTLTGFKDDELKRALLKLCQLRLCAPVLEQRASIAGFRTFKEWGPSYLAKLRERRDYAFKRCNEIPGLNCVKPAAAFYAFPAVEWPRSDEDFVLSLLRETGVLTVHGSGFGAKGKHFRFVFLPPLAELGEAFDAIDGFMRKQ